MDTAYVRAVDINMFFPIKGGIFQRNIAYVKAVDGVSLEINKGETVGLVGETGCGKTTLARCLLRLLEPTKGKVFINGADLKTLSSGKMRDMRRHIQMIFENPALSLDPGMMVWELIGEPLKVHRISTGKQLRARVDELLRMVELEPYHAERHPNELSGGEKQRVEIARALATAPTFVVCDNALGQLDTSTQGQITALLMRLRQEYGIAYLFIAHDLALVRQISDRVAVMYSGKIMEIAECDEFFRNPLHPYSKALLFAVLKPDPKAEHERKILLLPGELPSPISPPPGCRFHPRCPIQNKSCSKQEPELNEIKDGHFVACHFAGT
jgi:oligopeptide transport system ATP-binding protein